jgi:hypothetical protein
MVKSVMLLSVPRVKTEVTCPGTPEGTTATPGTLINAWATLVYWLFSKSSCVMTVVEVAVVSTGCVFRVAAVTTMMGSCVTAGCSLAVSFVEVLAAVGAVLVFAGAAGLTALALGADPGGEARGGEGRGKGGVPPGGVTGYSSW